MPASVALVGKWRIVESGTWPRDHLDLCGPAFLRIDAEGTGDMAFGALCASVDAGFTRSGVEFDWNGADERDQVTGTGWADLRDDGWIEGDIAYDNGDYTSFIAKPWLFQQLVRFDPQAAALSRVHDVNPLWLFVDLADILSSLW